MSLIMPERSSIVKNYFHRGHISFHRPFDLNYKPPYPRFPIKPNKGARPVTIAAGFTCGDGLVLATDLQVTEYGGMKRVGGKSTYFRASNGVVVGIAGAGFYSILAYACEIMEQSVRGANLSLTLSSVRKVLAGVYKQHVRPSYTSDQWEIALQLIIGIVENQDAGFDFGLYTSSRTVVVKVGPYDFVGAGRELAYYVIKTKNFTGYPRAFRPKQDLRPGDSFMEAVENPTIDESLPAIRELMTEVTENVELCGKGIKILKLPFLEEPSYDPP